MKDTRANPLYDALRAEEAKLALSPSAGSYLDTPMTQKQLQIQQELRDTTENLERTRKENQLAESSLAARMGLEENTTPYNLVNAGASLLSGGSRGAGEMIAAPLTAAAAGHLTGVGQEALEAYPRYLDGTASERDLEVLNTPQPRRTLGGETANARRYRENREAAGQTPQIDRPEKKKTQLDALRSAGGYLAAAKAVTDFTDISSIVDQRDRQRFSRDLAESTKDGVDQLKNALGKLGDGDIGAITDFLVAAKDIVLEAGPAALRNPQAMAEYLAEMVPDLLLGGYSKGLLATRNLGYGLESFRAGVEKYQEEHNGMLPPEDQREYMLINALAASAAEMVGDVAILASGGKGLNLANQAGAVRRAGRVARESAEGSVSEGFTEGLQTYLEGEAGYDPASIEDIVEGATIGAVVGGGLSGGISGAKEVVEAGAQGRADYLKRLAESAAQTDLVNRAIETGDVSELVNPEKTTYRPDQAAAILRERVQNEELDQEARSKAEKDLEALASQVAEQSDSDNDYTEEGLAQLKQQQTDLASRMEGMAEGSEQRERAGLLLEAINERVGEIEGMDKASRERAIQRAARTNQYLKTVQNELAQVKAKQNTSDVVTSTVEAAQSPEETPERAEAVEKTITLAMQDPDAFDEATLDALSQSSNFSPEQQAYLKAALEDKVQFNAVKDMAGVGRDIFSGGPGYRGLPQYRTGVGQAIASGDMARAERELAGIRRFEQSHSEKAAGAARALEVLQQFASKGQNRTVYMTRDLTKNGGWKLSSKKPEGWSREKGDLSWDSSQAGLNRARKMSAVIGAEARAVSATRAALEAAVRAAVAPPQRSAAPAQAQPAASPASAASPAQETQTTTVTEELETPTRTEEEAEAETQQVEQAQETPVEEADAQAVAPAQAEGEAQGPDAEQSATETTEPENTNTEEEVVELGDFASDLLSTLLGKLEEHTDEPEPGAGTHPVIAEGTEDADNRLTNFVQIRKDTARSQNPLVEVPDFLARLSEGTSHVLDFLGLDSLTGEQENYIRQFTEAAKKWSGRIRKNIEKAASDPRFKHEDYIQYSRDNLPENWVTAISAAAFLWVADAVRKGPFNTESEMKKILGLKDYQPLPQGAENLLLDVGTRRNLVIQSLGAQIAKSLGLFSKGDVPVSEQTKMELSLGTHALALLLQEGIAQEVTVRDPLLKRGNTEERTRGQPFIRLKFDENYNFGTVATRIFEASKGTGSVLNKLFGIEAASKAPSFTPVKFTQKSPKKSRTNLAKSFVRKLNKLAKEPYVIRPRMFIASKLFSTDTLKVMAGYKRDGEYTIHKVNLKRERSKNDAVSRDIDNLLEWQGMVLEQEGGIDTPFYLTPSVWKQQRVGFAENLIDPQQSTAHRFYVGMKGQQVTIDLKSKNAPKLMKNFRLGIAQGLGIKVDKQNHQESLEQLDALMQTDEVQKIIAILKDSLEKGEGTELSPVNQKIVSDFVVDRAGLHSLHVLMEWANFELAVDSGTPFTTDVMIEVDGVTNGMALLMVQLGLVNKRLGEMFGFFTRDSGHSDYIEAKVANKGLDLYENIMRLTQEYLPRSPESLRRLKAIEFFTGKLTDPEGVTKHGRDLVKQPVTATGFGSGIGNTVDAMKKAFVENFYAKLEEAEALNDKELLRETIANANRLLPKKLRMPMVPLYQASSLHLGSVRENILASEFENTVGAAFKQAMNSFFKEFIETRSKLNTASQIAWKAYDIAFQHLYAKARKDKPATEDLTPQEINAIREELAFMDPLAHTASSKMDGDIASGFMLASQERRIAPDGDKAYSAVVKFGENLPPSKEIGEEAQREKAVGAKSMLARGMKQAETDPGVGAIIQLIHALDSWISSESWSLLSALNLHDANGYSVADVELGSATLNQAAFRGLRDWSLADEVRNGMERTLEGLSKFLKTYPEAKNSVVGFNEFLRLKGNPTAQQVVNELSEFRSELGSLVAEINKNRLEYLSQVGYVSQYPYEGASYQVSEKQSEAAQKLLTEGEPQRGEAATPVSRRDEGRETPYGLIGRPDRASDPVLKKLLESRKSLKLSQVMPTLRQRITAGNLPGRIKAFQLELLRQIDKMVDPNIEIKLITPESPAPKTKAKLESARGWVTVEGNKVTVFIKNTDFVSSAITTETLLHELTHAAVARYIEDSPKSPAVVELRELRKAAEEYIRENNIRGMLAAVENVQELVAWGMTNEAFQRDVLSKLTFKSKNSESIKTSGFKAFIQNLVNILFRGSSKSKQEIAENGLAVLVANVSLVMEGAKATKPSEGGGQGSTLILRQDSNAPTEYTTAQTFEALGHGATRPLDPGFQTHLLNMLQTVTGAVYGPFGVLKGMAERDVNITAQDAFLSTLATGEAPFASQALSKLPMTQQEAFVLESLEVTLREALEQSQFNKNELRKVFRDARAKIKPEVFFSGDWSQASALEKKAAQDAWDFFFKIESRQDGISDYLSRFAAAALAYEPLNKALKSIPGDADTDLYAGKNLAQRLVMWFNRLMREFGEFVTRTYESENPEAKIQQLARNLAKAEARRKAALARKKGSAEEAFNLMADNLSKKAREGIEKVAGTDFFRKAPLATVRASAAAVRAVAGDRADLVLEGIKKVRDQATKGELGLLASILTEVKGLGDNAAEFMVLFRGQETHDRNRNKIKDSTKRDVYESFARPLSKDQSSAVTNGLLRTDAYLVYEKKGLAGLENLLRDEKALSAEITRVMKSIKGKHADYYRNAAEDLGYFLATDRNTSANLTLNPHNIASLMGTDSFGSLTEAEIEAAIPDIDYLATLFGLYYTSDNTKQNLLQVIAQEADREGDVNGLEFVLKLHKKLQQEAKETLFADGPVHFMKGYTREIFNPFNEVTHGNKAKADELMKAGWELVGELEKDPIDVTPDKQYLLILRDSAQPGRVNGSVSMTGMHSRGSEIHGGVVSADGTETYFGNVKKNREIAARRRGAVAEMFKPRKPFTKRGEAGGKMLPVFNLNGEIVTHRYVMNAENKDTLLERDSRVENVMGNMAAHAYDKANSEGQNRNVFQALYEDYKTEFKKSPEAYLEFGPNSPDKKLREAYKQLPENAKKVIRQVWGSDRVMIRNDVLNMTLGYTKRTLAEMLELDYQVENVMEKLFVDVAQYLFKDQAALKIRRGGEMWDYLVKQVKDFWVVKSVDTAVGNIKFNIGFLILAGLNPVDMGKNLIKGFVGLVEYERDERKLMSLERALEIDYVPGDRAAIEQEIAELKDAIARNPVKPLIDAGLYHTIAEDIEAEEDAYGYKPYLGRKVDEVVSKLPDSVVTAGKWLYMTHDTPLYKVLHQGVHKGDFIARFALYQHVVNRKTDPMTHEEAIEYVDDAFVNYGPATHSKLQWMNDKGLLPFTKYYLRMQRVLFRAYRDNPGRLLTTGLLENLFSWFPSMTDPMIWEWMSRNPGASGALEYPGALTEAITLRPIQAAL